MAKIIQLCPVVTLTDTGYGPLGIFHNVLGLDDEGQVWVLNPAGTYLDDVEPTTAPTWSLYCPSLPSPLLSQKGEGAGGEGEPKKEGRP